MEKVVQLAVVRERRGPTEPRTSKAELAGHFRVTPSTINRWMKLGLPFEKPFEQGSVRFSVAACDDWFIAGGKDGR